MPQDFGCFCLLGISRIIVDSIASSRFLDAFCVFLNISHVPFHSTTRIDFVFLVLIFQADFVFHFSPPIHRASQMHEFHVIRIIVIEYILQASRCQYFFPVTALFLCETDDIHR